MTEIRVKGQVRLRIPKETLERLGIQEGQRFRYVIIENNTDYNQWLYFYNEDMTVLLGAIPITKEYLVEVTDNGND